MAENKQVGSVEKYFMWIPGFIRHDFLRKLFALVFTGIVMYYVYPRTKEYTEDYPIYQIRVNLDPADGYLLTSYKPEYVNAVFKGDKGKLNSLNARDVVFTALIGEKEYKEKKVILTKDNLKFKNFQQGNIQLSKIEPEAIELKVNKIVEQFLPIAPVYDESKLPKGYCVQSVSFPNDNNQVSVHGDEGLLKNKTEVKTKPIPLKNQIADFQMNIPLDSQGLECKKEVVVNVKISRYNSKTFMNLPVRVLLSPEQLGKFTVDLGRKEADIQLRGKKEDIESLKPDEVHPYLDLTKHSADKEHLNVPVDLHCAIDKPNIIMLNVDKIRVTLKKIENAEKTEEKTDKK